MEILILALVAILLYVIAYHQGKEVGKLEVHDTREMDQGSVTRTPKEDLRWKVFSEEEEKLKRAQSVYGVLSLIALFATLASTYGIYLSNGTESIFPGLAFVMGVAFIAFGMIASETGDKLAKLRKKAMGLAQEGGADDH